MDAQSKASPHPTWFPLSSSTAWLPEASPAAPAPEHVPPTPTNSHPGSPLLSLSPPSCVHHKGYLVLRGKDREGPFKLSFWPNSCDHVHLFIRVHSLPSPRPHPYTHHTKSPNTPCPQYAFQCIIKDRSLVFSLSGFSREAF